MHKRPLQTTQRKGQRTKSQALRQTTSGNKNLKLTNKGQNLKTVPINKQKKDPLLKVSQCPNNKKPSSKQKLEGSPGKPKKKASRQSSQSKQKGRKKIISYKSQQSDKQSEEGLKRSVVQIQFPPIDDTIDDDINLLSVSNYPIHDNKDFLRDTHVTTGLSKNKYAKEDVKKHQSLKKTYLNVRKTNSKKPKDQYSLTKNGPIKAASQEKYLLNSNRKATLQKSHKKLQRSTLGLKVSSKPIQQSARGAILKTKEGKKEKSSSTQTKKGNSSKKNQQLAGHVRSIKKPAATNLPKSIPKPTKSKKKQNQKKKLLTNYLNKFNEESSSDTTKTPTFQQLQKLREQNEKYKMFLASSAFKVDELKKQIEQHKQIRQNERSIYNFQLNNLKKQLDANKRYLGHLYSYDEPSAHPNGFIPDQIIIETDNESSSVRESMNMHSKMSKQLGADELLSEGSNKIRKSNESLAVLAKSNPSSFNSNDQESKVARNDLTAVIKEIKEDLLREEAQLKFLAGIQKIPSLQVRLSLENSDKNLTSQNQNQSLNATTKHKFLKKAPNISNMSNEEAQNMLLLLDSISK